jgi:hypothetical protein
MFGSGLVGFNEHKPSTLIQPSICTGGKELEIHRHSTSSIGETEALRLTYDLMRSRE